MEFSGKRKRGMYFQGSWYAWFSYARLSNFREVQLTHFVEVLRVKLCFVWNYSQGYWLGKVKKKKFCGSFQKSMSSTNPLPPHTARPPAPTLARENSQLRQLAYLRYIHLVYRIFISTYLGYILYILNSLINLIYSPMLIIRKYS